MTVEQLEEQLLDLSEVERVRLAHVLIDSLTPEAERDSTWDSVLRDRIRDWEAGNIEEVSSDDAHALIDAHLDS